MWQFQEYGRVAEPGAYGQVPIAICSWCGFKMQNPRFEDSFYTHYYRVMYRSVAFGAKKPSSEYIAQQRDRGLKLLDFLKRQTKHIEPGKMLDHGCASGATMIGWRDAGWDVCGIDPHQPSVDEAKAIGLDVRLGVGESLPFADGSFDLVLSLGSTEHSYNLDSTMREIYRVIKPGGKLIIRWRSNDIFGSPLEYYNHNHYRFFTRNSWNLCLKRYGFRVDVLSDERVEGWDSYEYIVASKSGFVVKDLIGLFENQETDDPQLELKKIDDIRKSYYERCKRFISVYAAFECRPDELVNHLRRNPDLKWGWLGGAPDVVTARSFKEANWYITEYEAGRVR